MSGHIAIVELSHMTVVMRSTIVSANNETKNYKRKSYKTIIY